MSANAFDEAMRALLRSHGIAIGEDAWRFGDQRGGDSTVNRIDPETGEVTPGKSTLGIPSDQAGEGAVWIERLEPE